jgi:hypothetical protein
LKPSTGAELDCSLLQFIRGPHQAVAGTAPTSFNTAAAALASQLLCKLAGQALSAAVAAGHGVIALGREWFAAHRTVDLLVPHPAALAGTGVGACCPDLIQHLHHAEMRIDATTTQLPLPFSFLRQFELALKVGVLGHELSP